MILPVDIPQTPGCYVLFDECGRPLYVGSTFNLRNRLKYSHPHLEKASDLKVIPCSRNDLERSEQSLIDELRPKLNVILKVGRMQEKRRLTKNGMCLVTVSMTPEDEALIEKLKRKLARQHGKLSTTGLVRLLLRCMDSYTK